MWIPVAAAPWILPASFRGYQPQSVTRDTILRWLRQFERRDRPALVKLLQSVVYITQAEIEKMLLVLNERLLTKLGAQGIAPDHVVYVTIDDAGSSSGVVLNMLRNAARLKQLMCRFVDARDLFRLNEATAELGVGAIVYVDDFAGTGDQFVDAHTFAADYIAGTFSEFYLAPCMCEEALLTLGQLGVTPYVKRIHSKDERPLHHNGTVFDKMTKERLIDLAHEMDGDQGLGYGELASMVVFFHGAPDTVPLLLRGNIGQQPMRGVLPRFDDLPAHAM